jgi:hypothetical protein
MAVTLTKVADEMPELGDNLSNSQWIKCPVYGQPFRLAYSDTEWHRVGQWLAIAQRELRKDHIPLHNKFG